MNRTWLRFALLNFVIAASLGALLRYAFVAEVPGLRFKYVLHAHSHVAMLGWVYLALFTFLISAFLHHEKRQLLIYRNLFWLTQIAVFGMLVSFPVNGYYWLSITFSTLHILLSYIFTWRFLKDLPPKDQSFQFSGVLIKSALFFMVLSSLGVWVLGPIMVTKLKGSAFYYGAVQFYLHFQFNGWFIFGILGLFFKLLESKNIKVPKKAAMNFYWLLVISCVLTYALAVAWSSPHPVIFWINSLGVLIQLAAAYYLVVLLRMILVKHPVEMPSWSKAFFKLSLLGFLVKIIVQSMVALPFVAVMAYTIRNYVIGFIHLVLLGVVSLFLFGYGMHHGAFSVRSLWSRAGLLIFLTGLFLSETLLGVQGTMLWARMGFLPGYDLLLFTVSVLMPVGLLVFWIRAMINQESKI